jgi:hypothetical protein
VYASGRPIRLEFDQAVFVRSNQKLLAAVHIEFAENAGEVMAHGRAANAEAAGNIFVGQALSNQAMMSRSRFVSPRTNPAGTGIRSSKPPAELVLSNALVSQGRQRATFAGRRQRYSMMASSTTPGWVVNTRPSIPDDKASNPPRQSSIPCRAMIRMVESEAFTFRTRPRCPCRVPVQ